MSSLNSLNGLISFPKQISWAFMWKSLSVRATRCCRMATWECLLRTCLCLHTLSKDYLAKTVRLVNCGIAASKSSAMCKRFNGFSALSGSNRGKYRERRNSIRSPFLNFHLESAKSPIDWLKVSAVSLCHQCVVTSSHFCQRKTKTVSANSA